MIPTDSWFDLVHSFGALLDAEGHAVPAHIAHDGIEHVLVGCDLGNAAIKLALRQATAPQLRLFRCETVYTPATIVRAGDAATALRVQDASGWREWFWPDLADAPTGEALPIGATAERLADPRLRDLLLGALVTALERSDYPPGAYTLWLGLGIPNEEVSSTGVEPSTRQALRGLRGESFVLERRDNAGVITTWTLAFGELVPAAQSLGSFIAWYHTLNGRPAIDAIDAVTVVDLGGGHLSRFDIEVVRQLGLPPRFRGTGIIMGEGMVVVARELIELLKARYQVRLSESAALHALLSRTALIAGRRMPIDDMITQAMQTRGQLLLATLAPLLADQRRWLLFVGGGVVGLHTLLETRLAAASRAPTSYLIAPPGIAANANAVGLFALALYAAQRSV